MKHYKLIAAIFFFFGLNVLSLTSCKKDQLVTEPTIKGTITINVDSNLYELAKDTVGYTWFKFSDASLPKSSGSGHSAPFLRTRFNAIATTQLDSLGRVKTGITFPEGSVIVKELLNSDNSLERYAILLKETTNEFADANGWVWGYIRPNGGVSEKAENKGRSCIFCHAQSGSIDYMLMNKFYP